MKTASEFLKEKEELIKIDKEKVYIYALAW